MSKGCGDESANTSCPSGGQCDGDGTCSTKRRALLGSIAAGGLGALAGCVGVFGEPAPQEQPPFGTDDVFDISFEEQAETIAVSGDEYLLHAGEAQGWNLPYFCRTGFCGVCLAKVDGDGHELVEMTVNQFEPLDDDAIEEGYVLTCTGQPRGEFSIQTGMAGALTEEDDPEEEDTEDDEITDAAFHTIDFLNQEWTIEVPEDQALLIAGEDRGFDLPYQCREGFCGQCTAKIDGDGHELVEMTNNEVDELTADRIEEGYVLTCVGYPRGSFELESHAAPDIGIDIE